MKHLQALLQGKCTSHILPFLWMKGEDNETIKKELDKIEECGIREVCLESRPHPDFCGPKWWENLDFICEEAEKRGLRLWILDDKKFPTGYANGGFEKHPEKSKLYLGERHMDIMGPCRGGAVLVENFIPSDGRLLGILAVPKPDGQTLAIKGSGILNLTDTMENGFVYFDLPEGAYRLFILFTTRTGGGRDHYMNLIDSSSVKVLLDEVYEKHYARYSKYFGNVIAGFFSDEPELGNVKGYPFDNMLGQKDIRLPWSDELERKLTETWKEEFLTNLPALWYDSEEKTAKVRTEYMDAMTHLVHTCFSNQIGSWCQVHGVEYIGHIIEDDNAHARMGCSIGHYFREMEGQHMAGIDVVHHQIVPGFTQPVHQWIAGDRDGEFFHFGLAKLGSSAAHIQKNKKDRALCEIFGNYGWAEGNSFMKWLTNHMLVRGINEFTPHAFSMKYPDPDCPPHFYARGMNPQFPYFKNLMEYCNRVSHLISNGVHIPAVAVVYPAEQEWAGEYLPVEAIGKQLLRNQIDYEILPTDVLLTMTVVEGKLKWENEQVPVLILSGSRCITKMLADWLCKAAEKGLKIVVVGQKPLAMDNNGILREWTSQIKDNLTICEQEDLADILYSFGVDEIKTKKYEPWLRYYHYKHQNGEFWLFMNQSETEEINTSLCFEDGMMDSHKIDKECSCWYQAWENTVEPCEWDENNDLSLQLVPGEMKVLYMGDCTPYAKILAEKQEIMKLKKATDSQTGKIEIVPDAWKLCIKETGTEKYVLQEREKTGDFCRKHPYFCGVMRYETTVFLPKIKSCELNLGEVYETAHVLVNEKEAGVRVALPYSFEIGKLLHEGENRIIVEVVNTLANRQRDFFSMTMPIEPSGLIGPVTLDYF